MLRMIGFLMVAFIPLMASAEGTLGQQAVKRCQDKHATNFQFAAERCESRQQTKLRVKMDRLVEQLSKALEEQEKGLVEAGLVHHEGLPDVEALKDSQRDFADYMKRECERRANASNGTKGGETLRTSCEIDKINARIQELKAYSGLVDASPVTR